MVFPQGTQGVCRARAGWKDTDHTAHWGSGAATSPLVLLWGIFCSLWAPTPPSSNPQAHPRIGPGFPCTNSVLCPHLPFYENLLSNPVHRQLNHCKGLFRKRKKRFITKSMISNGRISSICKGQWILWQRLFFCMYPTTFSDFSIWLWH